MRPSTTNPAFMLSLLAALALSLILVLTSCTIALPPGTQLVQASSDYTAYQAQTTQGDNDESPLTPATYQSVKTALQTTKSGFITIGFEFAKACVNGDCNNLEAYDAIAVVNIDAATNKGTLKITIEGEEHGPFDIVADINDKTKSLAIVSVRNQSVLGILIRTDGMAVFMMGNQNEMKPACIGAAFL